MRATDIPIMANGVYAIRNTITGMVYIGCTMDIRSRWYQHVGKLRRGEHYNRRLQAAWSTYGADAFVVDIIEKHWHWIRECPVEQRHIAAYAGNAYNVQHIPSGTQLRFDWADRAAHPEPHEADRGE